MSQNRSGPDHERIVEVRSTVVACCDAMARGAWQEAFSHLTYRLASSQVAGVLFGAFHLGDPPVPTRDFVDTDGSRGTPPTSLMALLKRHGLPTSTNDGFADDLDLGSAMEDILHWMESAHGEKVGDVSRSLSEQMSDPVVDEIQIAPDGRARAQLVAGGRTRRVSLVQMGQQWKIDRM